MDSIVNTFGAFGGLFFVFYFYQNLMRESAHQSNQLKEQLLQENMIAKARQEEVNRTLSDLESARDADRKRNWATEGIAHVATLLRTESESDSGLYDDLISYSVKYMESESGWLIHSE